MSKLDKIVEMANEEVKNNSLYLWGGQGEYVMKTTPRAIMLMEKNKERVGRILGLLSEKLKDGIDMNNAKYFDCSGLVVYILQKLKVVKNDYTADMIFKELCVEIQKHDLKAGDLVFIRKDGKCNHVGIYVEDGIVVESAGRDLGVVRRAISKNYWNCYGRLKNVR